VLSSNIFNYTHEQWKKYQQVLALVGLCHVFKFFFIHPVVIYYTCRSGSIVIAYLLIIYEELGDFAITKENKGTTILIDWRNKKIQSNPVDYKIKYIFKYAFIIINKFLLQLLLLLIDGEIEEL
jgi:hypothetical protein